VLLIVWISLLQLIENLDLFQASPIPATKYQLTTGVEQEKKGTDMES